MVSDRMALSLFPFGQNGMGLGYNERAALWSGRLLFLYSLGKSAYFTLTAAILTTNWSLIIRTARSTTIIRVTETGFMAVIRFRPIIGLFINSSRGKMEIV